MRIKIIVDDWYLKNWYGLAKGATRKVIEPVYNNKKKQHLIGYKVDAVHLYESNIKGLFRPIFIKKHEAVEIKDYSK